MHVTPPSSTFLAMLLAAVPAILMGSGAPAQSGLAVDPADTSRDDDGDDDQNPFSQRLDEDPVHQAQRRAEILVERALFHLSERLRSSQDGALPSASGKDPMVAKMALTALAFMAYGQTTEHCRFQFEVRKCVRWLIKHAQEVEVPAGDVSPVPVPALYFSDSRDNISRMHGHGYATWAVAMAYGMTMGNRRDRAETLRVLQGAVRCIEKAQTESGGWGYEYERGTFHEGSMTVTQLQALRAARDAGIHVDDKVIKSAVHYLYESQIREGPRLGAFRYKLGDLNSSFALTAAAVSSLNQTGVYSNQAIDDGLESMRQNDPLMTGKMEKFPWYSRLYACQAYWQYHDLKPFRRFYPVLVAQLEREVNPDDGSYSNSEHGSDYATAFAVLALSVPFGYLPSFQR